MFLIIGVILVIVSTLGGYAALGGQLSVLMQPFEFVIIAGGAVGAYIIANPKTVLQKTLGAVRRSARGPKYKKEHFLELLTLQYQIFKVSRVRGLLTLEQHIEKPNESALFASFPLFNAEEHAKVFFCDYLRLITVGSDNPLELETLMDEEIEIHHQQDLQVSNALQVMADGMPALGIVAAVLGVIKTMGSITEPPEVLGRLIGGALVGTFLGVWISYGYVAPIANSLRSISEAELKYLQSIKAGILAHLHGSAPAISVEYARKALTEEVRPNFYELEDACGSLPPA